MTLMLPFCRRYGKRISGLRSRRRARWPRRCAALGHAMPPKHGRLPSGTAMSEADLTLASA